MSLIGAGFGIFLYWPVEATTDPKAPAIGGFDVLFKLMGGTALTLGGATTLLSSLALWGIHELLFTLVTRTHPALRSQNQPQMKTEQDCGHAHE